MKVLGIIPARSGSKGIPGKNIKLLDGKPLLAYTAESALNSSLLSKVIVSTDSDEIASVARKHGLEVPFLRPPDLATDSTPTLPVVLHCLHELELRGFTFDAVCLLQPTTPFRRPELIDDGIRLFQQTGCDSLVSVLEVPDEFNPHWTFEPSKAGLLTISTGESSIIPRRQELPKAYHRDGALYITRTEILQRDKSLYGTKIGYIISDPKNHINLDTMEDWEYAEKLVLQFR